jgi:hypothetical protein
MPPLIALTEQPDGKWNVVDLNVAGVFASALFVVAGLASLIVLMNRRHARAVVNPELSLDAEYSLINGETAK